jgi:hypothetical protein
MVWTREQLKEALELIGEIHKSIMETQRMLDDMIKSADRINAMWSEMPFLNSPSICPILNP